MSPMDTTLPVAAMHLIPHRGRMQLIDQLQVYAPDDGQALLEVRNDNLFLNERSQLDSVVLLELLAQTAAAHSGYKALTGEGNPMAGFLVGVKDFALSGSAQVGDTLQLIIHRDFQMEQVTFLSGRVVCDGKELATGVLKLWEMEQEKITTAAANPIKIQDKSFDGWNARQQRLIQQEALQAEIVRHCQNFDAQKGAAEFVFASDFTGFDGHFPGNPIVPGVLLLKTGFLLAELQQEQGLKLSAIKTAKFARTVMPGETIAFEWKINEGQIKTVVRCGGELCAKYSLEITNDEF